MNTFGLIISTPDGNVYNDRAVMLTVRGVQGELAVLAGHAPFVTIVLPCDLKIELADENADAIIGHTDGGLLTVSRDAVTLLTGRFIRQEQ